MKINNNKTAIISNNQNYSYQALQKASDEIAFQLLENKLDISETRVAFMIEPSFEYVAVQWGVWKAGGVAVPLCVSYPLDSLAYVLEDTQTEIIVVSSVFEDILRNYASERNIRFIVLREGKSLIEKALPVIESHRRAMILYTSGTTNLPKGVVTTHANLEAQITTLINAWQYSETDHTLCILPLHHVHGIINVISCTLWAGGTVEFLPNFSTEAVFEAFEKQQLNVFMAVPTIYFKLIAYLETLSKEKQQALFDTMKKFRLMVSGSAALPVSVMEKWEKLSGHRLLERYGMTELGMAISNPYQGERRAGHIGQPLPGVSVRLVDEENKEVEVGQAGEIQVKGANVFKEYWKKEAATIETFTEDGWFKTGDVAIVEYGYYRILGRSSIDIIKSGGYKISALEIEEVLRTYPNIKDCSVVGLDNEEWGELVSAALIVESKSLNINELNDWIRQKMPAYKVPRKYIFVEDFPKNAMGKVVKNDLKKMFL
jgi:malonyl-CoA/methylmalonyl-CoA synthetase